MECLSVGICPAQRDCTILILTLLFQLLIQNVWGYLLFLVVIVNQCLVSGFREKKKPVKLGVSQLTQTNIPPKVRSQKNSFYIVIE